MERRLLLSEIKDRSIDAEGSEAAAKTALINHMKTRRLRAYSKTVTDEDGTPVMAEGFSDANWAKCSINWDENSLKIEIEYNLPRGRRRGPIFRYYGNILFQNLQFYETEIDQIWPVKSSTHSRKNTSSKLSEAKVAKFINDQPTEKKSLPQWKALAEIHFGRKIPDHSTWRKVTHLIDKDKRRQRGEKNS